MFSEDQAKSDTLLQSCKDLSIIDPYTTIIKRIDLIYPDYHITTHTILQGKASEATQDSFKSQFCQEELKSLDIYLDTSESAIRPQALYLEDIVNKNEINLEFSDEDETVYIVLFWASWSKTSIKSLEDVCHMLEKHLEMRGKVRLLPISLDENRNEREWSGAEYLIFREKDRLEGIKQYGIEAVPELYLLHHSRTLWRGNPNSRDIEHDLLDLINAQPVPIIRASNLIPDLNQKLDIVLNAFSEFNEKYPYITPPNLRLNLRRSYDGVNISEKYTGFLLGSFIYKYTEDIHTLYQHILYEFPLVELKINPIPAIDSISLPESCSLCSRPFQPGNTQYICMFCSPSHSHCQVCEDTPREGKGLHKYAHHHYLYKIHPKAERLDEIMHHPSLAKPFPLVEDQPEPVIHSRIACDNKGNHCEGTVRGIRWKCAHCYDFDYCENCEKRWLEGEEELTRNLARSSHKPWHVMIKIPNEV